MGDSYVRAWGFERRCLLVNDCASDPDKTLLYLGPNSIVSNNSLVLFGSGITFTALPCSSFAQ